MSGWGTKSGIGRSYSDGFGCRVIVKHRDDGHLLIADETNTPGLSVVFLDHELEELRDLIQRAIDYNREHGIYPYKGRTINIDGMIVRVQP